MNFFNRLGHIEIISGKKILFSSKGVQQYKEVINKEHLRRFYDLDFKFSCSKIVDITTTNSEASISVLGLSRETIQFLATYRPTGLEINSQKRIRIYASYENMGDCLIFDGDIIKAVPSLPPNNWLEITARVGNYRATSLLSYAINGAIRLEDLIKGICEKTSLKPVYINETSKEVMEAKKKMVHGFDCSGTLYDLLQSINRISDFSVREDNGELICKLRDNHKVGTAKVIVLNQKTGMIGPPEILVGTVDKGAKTKDEPSTLRLKVKCFINPNINLWNCVYVQSVYLPDVNGLYTVTEIKYNGHLRGQEWYMILTLTAAYRGGNN